MRHVDHTLIIGHMVCKHSLAFDALVIPHGLDPGRNGGLIGRGRCRRGAIKRIAQSIKLYGLELC